MTLADSEKQGCGLAIRVVIAGIPCTDFTVAGARREGCLANRCCLFWCSFGLDAIGFDDVIIIEEAPGFLMVACRGYKVTFSRSSTWSGALRRLDGR